MGKTSTKDGSFFISFSSSSYRYPAKNRPLFDHFGDTFGKLIR